MSALLPLALWLLIRGVRDGRNWAWGAFAITVGLAVLSPHPQLLQYLLLTSGSFALFLALGADADGTPIARRTGVRRLALALAAVVVGHGDRRHSVHARSRVRRVVARAVGRDYAYATSFSFPFIELINLYLPQFTGILDKYWGPNGIHLHSEYIGGPVLLLATAAFGGDTRKRFRRFWIGTGIVAFIWMLGGSTPFFHLVYSLIPGTKFFRAPSTIIYVFSFALSVLAALGTERVLARDVSRKVLYVWAAIGVMVAVLASAGALTNMARAAALPYGQAVAAQQGYDPSVAPQIAEQVAVGNSGDVTVGAWRSLIFLALAVAAILVYERGRLPLRALGIGLVVIVAADQWSIARYYWLFSPPAKVLYATDPAVEFLKKEPQPGRVVVRALSDTGLAHPDPYFGTDREGRGTGLMVHGIRSITGYHGNELGRYQKMIELRSSNGAPATLSPMLWRHENTRYLYTNVAVADSQLKLLVGPVKNSAGSTVYLYRLPGDNPYAWVAAGMTKAPDDAVLQAVLDPRFDPLRLAVVSDTSPLQVPVLSAPPAPLDIKTTTSNYAPGHATIALSVPAPKGAALVVSENYYPGWRATADGLPQPTFRADYNLIGVPLPAGGAHRRVDLPRCRRRCGEGDHSRRPAARVGRARRRRGDGPEASCLSVLSSSSRRTTSGRTSSG